MQMHSRWWLGKNILRRHLHHWITIATRFTSNLESAIFGTFESQANRRLLSKTTDFNDAWHDLNCTQDLIISTFNFVTYQRNYLGNAFCGNSSQICRDCEHFKWDSSPNYTWIWFLCRYDEINQSNLGKMEVYFWTGTC